jgi:hypothetical protein
MGSLKVHGRYMTSRDQPYTTKLQLVMGFDYMAIISIASPIDMGDHYSILGKKFFFEISVVPLRSGGGRNFFSFLERTIYTILSRMKF